MWSKVKGHHRRLYLLYVFYFSFVTGNNGEPGEKEQVEIELETEEDSQLKSNNSPVTSATQKHNNNDANTSSETDRRSTGDKHSSIRSVSSLSSSHASAHVNQSSSRKSDSSHCEGAGPTSAMGLASSHGRLSSCSTVMVTEEQLMLNPVKPEVCKKNTHTRHTVSFQTSDSCVFVI